MSPDDMDWAAAHGKRRIGNEPVERVILGFQRAADELVAHARLGKHLRDELGSIAEQAESSDDAALALRVIRLLVDVDPERGRTVLERFVESASERGVLSRNQLEELAHEVEISEEAFICAAGRELAYDAMIDQYTEGWTVEGALRCMDEQDRSPMLSKIVEDAQGEMGVGGASFLGGPHALPYLAPALWVLAPLVYPDDADRWRWFVRTLCSSDSPALNDGFRESVTEVLNSWPLPVVVAQEVADADWNSMVVEDYFSHSDTLMALSEDED